MIYICILLLLVIIILLMAILYLNAYNSLIIAKIKMQNANKNIKEDLKKKYDLMNKLYNQIKKVIKKKNYLKDYNTLKIEKLNNYELDAELNKHLQTMIDFKEDFKELNTDEFNSILNDIKELDQEITANKKFFNKQNNMLIKKLKGHIKLVAKINKISVKNSYEIKEPNKD